MSLRQLLPNARETSDETKERVWRMHGYVCLSIDDPALPWDLREMLARFMTRRHGCRDGQGKRP